MEAKIASGTAFVVRLAVPEGRTSFRDLVYGEVKVGNEEFGDFVILRANGTPIYHLAVVLDDAQMGITHVIRGVDHLGNTPKHIHLYRALGIELPVYAHLPMILGPDKRRLSKRHSLRQDGKHFMAHDVQDYRKKGFLPDALINFIAFLGWSPGDDREIMGLEELCSEFALERVNKSNAIFDPEKLSWMNGNYIRNLSLDDFVEQAIPFLRESGLLDPEGSVDMVYVQRSLALVQDRMKALSDVAEATSYFFEKEPRIEDKAMNKHLTKPGTADILRRLRVVWQALPMLSEEDAEKSLRSLAEALDAKVAKLVHPARVSLTGRTYGPGLFELVEVLGKDRVLQRLERAALLAERIGRDGESSNGRTCGSGP